MELKTLHGWHEFAEKNSDGSWDKYCKPGDLVDEEVYDYFLDILPPRSMGRGYLQVGEPYSSAFDPEFGKWRQTFSTFRRVQKGVWMYLGNCFPNGEWEPEVFGFDGILDFLKKTYRLANEEQVNRPHIYCKDGFHLSIQAGSPWYCRPRKDLESGEYEAVEVGGLSEKEDLLLPYAEESRKPKATVYAFVPVSVVEKVIAKHGGVNYKAIPVV